ncbi:MAG: hypothetical protein AAF456_13065 [Planctomycetota bacterium]
MQKKPMYQNTFCWIVLTFLPHATVSQPDFLLSRIFRTRCLLSNWPLRGVRDPAMRLDCLCEFCVVQFGFGPGETAGNQFVTLKICPIDGSAGQRVDFPAI